MTRRQKMYIKKGEILRMSYGENGAETVDYEALNDFNLAVLKNLALRSPWKSQMLDTKNRYDAEPWFGEFLREEVGCVKLVKEPTYSVALLGDIVKVHLRTAIASNRNSKVK
jgi:hypothetical protein